MQFLNFRIIQSEHGISIDQTNHILQSILNDYFDKYEKVKYESNPFPLDSKFGYELYVALPMSEDELEKAEKKYNETYMNMNMKVVYYFKVVRCLFPLRFFCS